MIINEEFSEKMKVELKIKDTNTNMEIMLNNVVVMYGKKR